MQPLPTTSPRHAVQFYGTEQSLFDTVAVFLGEGLVSGQPAIVIATETHRSGILVALASRLIDVERARHGGGLIVLDARQLLETFVVGDAPSEERFDCSVGRIFDEILKVHPRTLIRIYGEIVDMLWKEGRREAAMAVEMLWNRLASRYGFALLCGYSMGNFCKEADQIEEVCRHHSHVIDPCTKVLPFPARQFIR